MPRIKDKRGRPCRFFDKQQFEQLCQMLCTRKEIAEFFECDEDTINNWCKREYGKTFKEVYKEKSVKGKISMRRAQYKAGVEDGNVTMLIWLGKQYLEQTDKQDIKNDNINANIDLSSISTEDLKKLLDEEKRKK